MKKDEKQLAYEAPVMEAVELQTEVSIMSNCGGVDSEDVCEDCGGSDEEL